MTKKIMIFLAVMLLCLSMFVSASAFTPVERTLPLVVDEAQLLSEEEESALIARCESFTTEHEMEIAVVTITDLQGMTAEMYADDFYDYNGYGYGENDDGILVLYVDGVYGERELHITTHGKGTSEFYDTVREEMYVIMKDLIIAEDYNGAFNAFVQKAEEVMKPYVSPTVFFVCVLFGVVGGLLVTNHMTSKNYSVYQRDATIYERSGSLELVNYRDRLVNTNIQRIPKATSNNNGGSRSTTHRSSSGRTHGGTGGRF